MDVATVTSSTGFWFPVFSVFVIAVSNITTHWMMSCGEHIVSYKIILAFEVWRDQDLQNRLIFLISMNQKWVSQTLKSAQKCLQKSSWKAEFYTHFYRAKSIFATTAIAIRWPSDGTLFTNFRLWLNFSTGKLHPCFFLSVNVICAVTYSLTVMSQKV